MTPPLDDKTERLAMLCAVIILAITIAICLAAIGIRHLLSLF